MSMLAGFVVIPLMAGVVGVLLGGGYLASGTWKLQVTVDESGLEVGTTARRRFRLAWAEVTRFVVSRSTNTGFVDGGSPERSLLIPGVGAPAPYDLEDRAALIAFIVEHVASDKVREVETLERTDPVSE